MLLSRAALLTALFMLGPYLCQAIKTAGYANAAEARQAAVELQQLVSHSGPPPCRPAAGRHSYATHRRQGHVTADASARPSLACRPSWPRTLAALTRPPLPGLLQDTNGRRAEWAKWKAENNKKYGAEVREAQSNLLPPPHQPAPGPCTPRGGPHRGRRHARPPSWRAPMAAAVPRCIQPCARRRCAHRRRTTVTPSGVPTWTASSLTTSSPTAPSEA